MYKILSQTAQRLRKKFPETEEEGPRKTMWHYVMCSWFQPANQGRPGPKSLRTEG